MPNKIRYAAVGTGGRVSMYIDPLASDYKSDAELVGLCDPSEVRRTYHQQRLVNEYGYHQVPTYPATDFDLMVAETRPEVVIVCSMDSTHHEYIVRALDLGCDVVTEKPMTIDAGKCRAIFEAVQRSGKQVRVAFNYRWAPGPTKVRELIASGTIGDIKAVNLEYQLNTSHGADYFRRWHSDKKNSGGLLVHKSTHHFDLVNWWIDGIPQEVFAWGGLMFYGRDNAISRGDEAYTRYERYEGASEASADPFKLNYTAELDKEVYLKAEAETGYVRDRNVFREGVTIEDTMAVLVKYRTGVLLNYSLVAYSPNEGYRVTFTGDRGRIEYTEMQKNPVTDLQVGEKVATGGDVGEGYSRALHVFPHFKPGYEVVVKDLDGGHGGGDPLLQEQIFSSEPRNEPWGRNAGHEQGAASILIGIAANNSMASGSPTLLHGLVEIKPEAKHLSELI